MDRNNARLQLGLLAVLLVCAGLSGGCADRKDHDESSRAVTDETSSAGSSSRSMVGMFSYMADAGLFSECPGGERVPVAHEGDNAALERAYLGAGTEPGEPLLVTLEGRIERRPKMEGDGTREFLIVDRFRQVWPGEDCGKATVETPLVNTYWRLVELNGKAVERHADQREVHLRLRMDEKQAVGFAGCNQFRGGYRVEGRTLTFERLASTMMACPHLDDEQAFLSVLEAVREFDILGETLDLRDDAGAVVARFKATYFE